MFWEYLLLITLNTETYPEMIVLFQNPIWAASTDRALVLWNRKQWSLAFVCFAFCYHIQAMYCGNSCWNAYANRAYNADRCV